jgi:hypothetical protein
MAVETLFAQIIHETLPASRGERVLLPVCCVCRLIRDETRSFRNHAHWVTEGTYRKTHGINPADFPLTHTYCPGCFMQVMKTMRAAQIVETRTVASERSIGLPQEAG